MSAITGMFVAPNWPVQYRNVPRCSRQDESRDEKPCLVPRSRDERSAARGGYAGKPARDFGGRPALLVRLPPGVKGPHARVPAVIFRHSA